MDALSLADVVALDGGFPVLAGASLTVARGTSVAVLGANGAGKTSLLRTLAGLTTVVAGTGHVLGTSVAELGRAVAGQVGLLGHDTGCYDELSARANLTFTARILRADRRRVDAALEAVALTGRLATTPVGELSAGQRRRAGLAQLLLREPALLLLDEPHASLDEAGRAVVDRAISAATARGATVLFTSHDPAHAARVATACVEVAGGMLRTTATAGGAPDAP